MPTLSRFHRRVREKAADAWAPPVLIVAFGDSVTQGMLALDEHAHEAVYHARFKRLLEAHAPLSTFSVINAGVGGQTAAGALALIERDVIRHQPDLTLVSFALNDAWSGLAGVSDFIDAMNVIVRRIRAETESDVILLTPNFMNRRELAGADPELLLLVRATAALQNEGVLAAYAQAVREVAQTHDLPCADVYRAWQDLATQGVDTDQMLANQMNHPTAEAHAIPAGLLMRIVTAPSSHHA
jgi:acyl-CoA thioesterase-1